MFSSRKPVRCENAPSVHLPPLHPEISNTSRCSKGLNASSEMVDCIHLERVSSCSPCMCLNAASVRVVWQQRDRFSVLSDDRCTKAESHSSTPPQSARFNTCKLDKWIKSAPEINGTPQSAALSTLKSGRAIRTLPHEDTCRAMVGPLPSASLHHSFEASSFRILNAIAPWSLWLAKPPSIRLSQSFQGNSFTKYSQVLQTRRMILASDKLSMGVTSRQTDRSAPAASRDISCAER